MCTIVATKNRKYTSFIHPPRCYLHVHTHTHTHTHTQSHIHKLSVHKSTASFTSQNTNVLVQRWPVSGSYNTASEASTCMLCLLTDNRSAIGQQQVTLGQTTTIHVQLYRNRSEPRPHRLHAGSQQSGQQTASSDKGAFGTPIL